MELAGKVALVTGAGAGIGAAAARLLAREGARVLALDFQAERAAAVAAETGGVALVADVADEAQMRAALATLERLDIVVHCAGINGVWAPIEEMTPAEWDRTVATNLRGTYLAMHFAVPHLKAAGGGAVVLVSSINGTRTFTTAGASVYSATKAAQAALANQLAIELARDRIRVNAIMPGSTKTQIGESTFRRNADAIRFPVNFPEGDIPARGHPAEAAEVAEAILFLVSDRARHISGTPLFIDAGQSLIR